MTMQAVLAPFSVARVDKTFEHNFGAYRALRGMTARYS